MNNLNKTYHKGKFRSGEWGKHIRPYLKRVGNKKWRKISKDIYLEENESVKLKKQHRLRKTIEVKITKTYFGDVKVTTKSKYRTLRDAKNAMNQPSVIRSEIL